MLDVTVGIDVAIRNFYGTCARVPAIFARRWNSHSGVCSTSSSRDDCAHLHSDLRSQLLRLVCAPVSPHRSGRFLAQASFWRRVASARRDTAWRVGHIWTAVVAVASNTGVFVLGPKT